MNKIWIGIAGVFLLIAVSLFGTYNNLVGKSTVIDGQWAQVETQYQRRFDLIPNLVNSTKGFLEQEKEIFETIAQARTQYAGARTVDRKVETAGELDSALSRLLFIIENYPNLKSNETVAGLMDELSGTENRISVERRRFNELVQEYNITVKRVPTNIIAKMFNFSLRPYFEAGTGAETPPKVEL
ncbi:LemA family protein [Candidatus Gottesmanbacteria bacterium RIFCSPHIGHO2_02_FULL_40_24]|uniref:LemA family protein n=1 Tax=Candidatus Gottesmanbacteria bacterium RIFCSPHIGHO2_01_FULL_40_15 TaxID=1798376 RepID=A0A1F5Z0M8_9BACT|nr:MAG: LemA family protein [Candidatus Gottesmanbacteria bacterium RIFCSPHIGHO2_01_FULL_40_15]OGG17446.1 MAG: LemA family protein [Candidatus Gottesmanbacteria bacterium RIFCSPHIGHO2_02_FULL_40_24]OGG22146.1 MAG: LemA family protein [Candidatus Gottesmanbacteria bacterium RIFCSPLOWO2_01_FULL_40_10]OGG25105.1 MAG: LemA family protein [Candidatus Gottesmanbacteria bacterium RIFCSPHIGHO2_12_FULL_40_13]OGG32773.1 MAG: LemA family protein [Candidatus Gottesmanbacteria bacterium RIFCSPLOWO2_02_FULL_